MKITDFKKDQLIELLYPNGRITRGIILEINERASTVWYRVIKDEEMSDSVFTQIDSSKPKGIHFAAIS
jgi:hypothetical protein